MEVKGEKNKEVKNKRRRKGVNNSVMSTGFECIQNQKNNFRKHSLKV